MSSAPTGAAPSLWRVIRGAAARWAWGAGPGALRVVRGSFDEIGRAMCEGATPDLEPEAIEEGAIVVAPFVAHRKIVCVGLNYKRHAEEMSKAVPSEPLIFLKASGALSRSNRVELPAQSELVHHEAELGLMIGRRARRASEADALSYVAGYFAANDVTARDIQRREGGRYTRAKGFDTFCPIGPCVRPRAGFEVEREGIELTVDGVVRQRSRFDDMIFGVPQIIAFISSVMTLEPGDLVLTGTPSGVGPLEGGEEVEIAISNLGVLRHSVARRT